MITFFRNISETWYVKFFLLLITISMMGLFGLGSMTSMWGKNQDAVKVGSSVIKGPQLVREVEREARRMSAMTGNTTYLSLNDAVKMGVVDKVVQRNVSSLLYQIAADDLDLIASNDAVGNYIVNNPAFQTMTGTFDRAMLFAYLQQAQMSEAEFTAALQEELARKHLTDAIDAVIKVPELMNEKVYDYTYEAKDMDLIVLPTTAVKVEGELDEETTQAYYESMQDDFYTPEYRLVNVLKLTPDKIMETIPVDEENLKALYAEKKDLYVKPEQRRIEQILVKDADEANALFAELTADNFAQIAKDKASQEDIDLGFVEKNGVAEQIGEVAFNAELNKVLEPVETPFGFHILVVRDVKEAQEIPFAEVKDELAKTIKAEKAYSILYDKSKLLEDALGEGLTLTDAAKRIEMSVDNLGFIDVSSKDKAGNSVDLPSELVQELFFAKSGEATSLQDYQNGFIVAEVAEIEPVSLKPIDAVQAEIKAEWIKDEQKKKAPEFAQNIFDAVQKDKALKTVALFHGLDEKPLTNVKRMDISDMPADVVARLFNAKENDIELIDMGNGDYVIVQIQKTIPADKEDKAAQLSLSMELKNQMVASVVDEVLAHYANKEKVEVNQAVINEAFAPYVGQAE